MIKIKDNRLILLEFIVWAIAAHFLFFPGWGFAETVVREIDQDDQEVLLGLSPSKGYSKDAKPQYIKGELIIKLKDGTSSSMLQSDDEIRSVKPVFKHLSHLAGKSKSYAIERGLDRVYVIELETSVSVGSILEKYKSDLWVEYIQPNYIYEPDVIPNDPRYNEQYAHQLTQAESAWNISTGSSNIVIAVIGTGVDIDHPDLAANTWINTDEIPGNIVDDDGNGYIDDVYGWNFYDDNNNPRPSGSSHETMVAGIIAAVGNNSQGICGVSWSSRIMPLRVAYTSADVAAAIEYAALNGAHIINMSFGNYTKSKYGDYLVKEMLDDAYEAGILLVATAGNDKRDWKRYPAALPNVIAAAATDQSDHRALWQYGYTGTNYGSWVDIAAPGSNILSTIPGGGYNDGNGTSYSAPYVAGLGALLLSDDPTLPNIEVRAILENTTDPVIDTEPDYFSIGTGRVNAWQALSNSTNCYPLGEINTPEHRELISINTQPISLAFLAHGDTYQVEYGTFGSDQWTSIGQGDPGAHTGEDGLIHLSFDNPGLGTYMLRLTVTKGGYTHVDSKMFGIEGDYQENWPRDAGGNYYIGSSAICMDIDEDGKNEIIQSSPGFYTFIWNEDGTDLPGWPQYVQNAPSNSTSAVGDVDGDGDYEVVTTTFSQGGVYVWHWQNGELLSGDWPKALGYMVRANPLLADLDGDGDAEIIVAHTGSGVNVFQHDGTLFWSHAISNIQAPMAAADLDGDGHIEIVVQALAATHVLDHQGNEVAQWSGGSHKPPVIADLDKDGELEIICIGAATLKVLHLTGPPTWTIYLGIYGSGYGATSVGDLNNDGYLDVFVTEYSGSKVNNIIYGFDHSGNPLTSLGFPKDTYGIAMQNTPAIGDINSDGKKEALVGSSSGLLLAWDREGNTVNSFPKLLGDYGFYTTAALEDLDGDGDIEVMLGGEKGTFYVWDLPGTYNPATIDWGMYRHDPQCSGLALLAPKLNPVAVPGSVHAGQTLQFTITASNPDNLPLHFYVRQMPIGASFDPHTGIFTWTPTADQVGGTYKFYLFLTDGIRQDHRPVWVTVLEEMWITLTSPNGGETWQAGSSQTITWTSAGITGNVKIILFKNGSRIGNIAYDIPAHQGSYAWTVGNLLDGTTVPPDTGYVIRVKSIENKTYYDDSDGSFTISDDSCLTLTAPNGGETWDFGTAQTITWTSTGLTGNVKLILFKNGSRLGNIAYDIPGDQGSYSWTVGNLLDGSTVLPGTGYVVRIKSIENHSCYDDSNASFTISGLILTSPNGGENWALGTSKSITWASGGIPGNVKLILFKNGARIGNIAYDIPASQGSYSWTVGSLLDGSTVSSGTGYVVRVKSIDDKTYYDDSDGGFTISDSLP